MYIIFDVLFGMGWPYISVQKGFYLLECCAVIGPSGLLHGI